MLTDIVKNQVITITFAKIDYPDHGDVKTMAPLLVELMEIWPKEISIRMTKHQWKQAITNTLVEKAGIQAPIDLPTISYSFRYNSPRY